VSLRFIEEIDGQYLEYLTPAENNYRYKPMIDSDIFEMWINQIAFTNRPMERLQHKSKET
jgi:hypothetical protein